ncbi:MAG: hypothetical protein RL664_1644 [Bacteroidota bacterium]
MKNNLKMLLSLFVCVITISCGEPAKSEGADSSAQTIAPEQIEWINPLIEDYINRSSNEMIVEDRKDTSNHFEWFLDRHETVNGTNYMVYHLGHVVTDSGLPETDEGEVNARFITYDWLYIDSLKRKLFVYDFATDGIVEWKL